MTYEIIENLVDKLSCDFVLADPLEPKSISALLPVLKQMHVKCQELSLNIQAKEILRARKIITDILNNPKDAGENTTLLGKIISELSSSIYESKGSEQTPDKTISSPAGPTPGDYTPGVKTPDDTESDKYDLIQLDQILKNFSNLTGKVCPGEISDIGAMINNLDELIESSEKIVPSTFYEVSIACKGYVENMTLENLHHTKPVEEGVVLLKSILRHLKEGEEFIFDYSDVLKCLAITFAGDQIEEDQKSVKRIKDKTWVEPASPREPEKISDDDMEILMDFVSEAEENLDIIEVHLIDLEQDPSNMDIINEIFRPFHTIKGVSGFLSLTKINQLAHATENLLDSARSKEFLINHIATDIILESVDTLKKLIARVKQGIENGVKQQDDDINVDTLQDKLDLAKREKVPIGQILVKKGIIDKESIDHALKIQQAHPEKKLGEILVEEKKVNSNEVASALLDQKSSGKKIDTQVKVSTQKLDDLVDYAGELVIAQSMLRQKTSKDPSLSQSVTHLGQIVTNMQNIAMSMRMTPIKATFMKMIRLVRDLSRKSGKQVLLSMKGEETEIDRNVVDALYEPMVHMIRNSIDHGIEHEAERLAKKKKSKGNITLGAYHKGGHIIIEIEDDGKGLDKDGILKKAFSSGLLPENATLTDAQVYDLILQPGFSTAKKITDVSGRGVGMDVVKDGIEKFRGQLYIESSKGVGTKFTISLPLTLAIIDGMLVKVDDQRYVIPTIVIQRAFKPAREDCFTVEGKGEMVKDKGNLVPVIRLSEIYNTSSRKKSIENSLVVVVKSKDEKKALVIDEILGKDEYVIKSLGSNLEEIESLAGGAILADGRVGLILDIYGLFSLLAKK